VPEPHPRKLIGAELIEAKLRVHARRNATSTALCGCPAGVGYWSTKRSAINCTGCCMVADQRIKSREERAKRWNR